MFSQHLKALRAEKNISQKELANRLFVSAQAVSKWEKDKASPNPETLAKIADILDISADYLLERTDKREKPIPVSGDGQIGPAKRNLLDMIDDMDEDELLALADLVKAAKKMRNPE